MIKYTSAEPTDLQDFRKEINLFLSAITLGVWMIALFVFLQFAQTSQMHWLLWSCIFVILGVGILAFALFFFACFCDMCRK